jgi:hypothetical protein
MKRYAFVALVPVSILLVTHNRMSIVSQLYAYLMLPARQQINFQQSKVSCFLEYSVTRMGQFSFCGVACRIHGVRFVLGQV